MLKDQGPIGFMALIAAMKQRLSDAKFGGSVGWYTTAVRLDMEAKGEISYDRKAKKPVFVLAKK